MNFPHDTAKKRPASTCRALVFDFDGLILDTEVPEFTAWQNIYRAHGGELSLEDWSVCIGTSEPVFDPWQHLQTQIGQAISRPQLFADHETEFLALVAKQDALPGVRATLKAARAAGWKIGLASSSPRSWVVGHLERLQLLSFFDDLKTKDDVKLTKPDPELYQAALRALNVAPGEAVALEDSAHGISAAQSAGMFCVAVPNDLTRHLNLSAADWQLESLRELQLPVLVERHARVGRGDSNR